MNVLITLTTAGADTGPFNLYSNTDSYVTAFATNIAKSLLVAGYTSTVVPTGTSTIRVRSTGTCTNYVDLVVTGTTPTTTTTTTPTPTTTTTTTAGGGTTTTTTTSGGGTTTTTTTSETPTTTTTTTTPSNQWYQLTNCDTLAVDYSTMYPPSGTQFVLNERVIDFVETIWKVTQIYTSNPGGSGLLIGPTGFTGCPGDITTTTTTTTPVPTTTTTTTPIPTTTTTTTAGPTTTTTTTTLIYFSFPITTGYGDSSSACGDSSTNISIYGSSPSFLSNATFYNDSTLLSPFDGSNLYYKNTSNNEYVQISSIGSQTAGGSC
jgi:hypothetical protein